MILSWEAIPLLGGFIFSYLIYTYKKFRMGGVISIPLLAIYTIKFPLMALIIALSSLAIFLVLEFLMERAIIYGRRLLYLSLSLSVILMAIIEYFFISNIEWYALLLSGLIAYNYHRENYSGIELTKSLIANFLLYFVCIFLSVFALWIIK